MHYISYTNADLDITTSKCKKNTLHVKLWFKTGIIWAKRHQWHHFVNETLPNGTDATLT